MKTTIALAVAMLLAANAHASPQHAEKPMDHGKMKMDHAEMKMPMTPEAREKMANTMFDRIDTDKNGSVSRAEFVEHHRAMSMEHAGMGMDHHGHDGKKHEGATDHATHAAAPSGPAFATLDSDKDGQLSKPEMAKHPMAAHFPMMDTDKDGFLSRKEAAAHGL